MLDYITKVELDIITRGLKGIIEASRGVTTEIENANRVNPLAYRRVYIMNNGGKH